MDIAALFAAFVILMIIGVPIAYTLAISSLFYIVSNGMNLSDIPQKITASFESFLYIALPLFILTGDLMNYGGITKKLVNFANVFVGRFRGGLAHINVVVSMLFAGVNGLSCADVVAVGGVMIPAMTEAGYKKEFSTAITVCSSVIGAIIPPSLLMIIYASTMRISIGSMFLGGMVPGILLGVAQMGLVVFYAKSKRYKGFLPEGEKLPFKTSVKYIKQGAPTVVLPILIIGCIAFGITTATEAACIAVVYGLVYSLFISKDLKLKQLPKLFIRSAKTSGENMILLGTCTIFAYILSVEKIPQLVSYFLLSVSSNLIVILLIINLFLIIVGTFMDPTPSAIILGPVIAPVLMELGMHPIHIGVFMCFNLIMGVVTPPVGGSLYLAAGMTGLSMEKISKAMVPFLIINVAVLILITYIPDIVLFLPRLFGFV